MRHMTSASTLCRWVLLMSIQVEAADRQHGVWQHRALHLVLWAWQVKATQARNVRVWLEAKSARVQAQLFARWRTRLRARHARPDSLFYVLVNQSIFFFLILTFDFL